LMVSWDPAGGCGCAPALAAAPPPADGGGGGGAPVVFTFYLARWPNRKFEIKSSDKGPRTGEGCDLGNSGFWKGDYGWGVRVRRHLAHAEGVLYGMELGSVTFKINTQNTQNTQSFWTMKKDQKSSWRRSASWNLLQSRHQVW
jgi:hypothetical protein